MTTSPSDLAGRVTELIDAELTHLRRRQPTLTPDEIALIEQALSDLMDRLVLNAIRNDVSLWTRVQPLFTEHSSSSRG